MADKMSIDDLRAERPGLNSAGGGAKREKGREMRARLAADREAAHAEAQKNAGQAKKKKAAAKRKAPPAADE